jgi:hypothetical protein
VLLATPLPLSKGLGVAAGLALGAAPAGWGPPTVGVSTADLANRTPLSSRVGSMAKITVLSPRSSQSTGMF